MNIVKVFGREIFDSRGLPTIECTIVLENGHMVTASAPSGLSCGSGEAKVLRDGGKRLCGLGVTKSVEIIQHKIAPLLLGKTPQVIEMDIKLIELDGTLDKSHLGSNTMIAVSMALAKAQAVVEETELYEFIARLYGAESVNLPFPAFNVINGGKYADNGLRIQEFMIMPTGAQSFREALELGVTFFQTLKELLQKKGKKIALGDEGGFASSFAHDIEAFDCLKEVIDLLSTDQTTFQIGIDVAASLFYDIKKSVYIWNSKKFKTDELIGLYSDLVDTYAIYSIEDGLSEHDREGWQRLTTYFDGKVQIAGDDIFSTHPERLVEGIEASIANAIVIKPNQVGTFTETLQTLQVAQENGYAPIVSHRSGETEDTFIADLAVGTSAGQIKAGGCSRGERMNKYNRLLTIEDELVFSILDV